MHAHVCMYSVKHQEVILQGVNPTNHGIVRCNFFHSIQKKLQSCKKAPVSSEA